MKLDEAKQMIQTVISNQKLTIAEHTALQGAWRTVLDAIEQALAAKEGVKDVDNATYVPKPLQQS